jgi:hypothetical protein
MFPLCILGNIYKLSTVPIATSSVIKPLERQQATVFFVSCVVKSRVVPKPRSVISRSFQLSLNQPLRIVVPETVPSLAFCYIASSTRCARCRKLPWARLARPSPRRSGATLKLTIQLSTESETKLKLTIIGQHTARHQTIETSRFIICIQGFAASWSSTRCSFGVVP